MTAPVAVWEQNLARTLVRALPWLALVFVAMLYLGNRFHVGVISQEESCLPPWTFWLMDFHDSSFEAGDPVVFHAGARMAPFFPPDLLVIKRVVGRGGDRVEVTPEGTSVNGEPVAAGLDLAKLLQTDPEEYRRTLVLADGELWIAGDTRDSYDSRYWGPLPEKAVVGRAHPIW